VLGFGLHGLDLARIGFDLLQVGRPIDLDRRGRREPRACARGGSRRRGFQRRRLARLKLPDFLPLERGFLRRRLTGRAGRHRGFSRSRYRGKMGRRVGGGKFACAARSRMPGLVLRPPAGSALSASGFSLALVPVAPTAATPAAASSAFPLLALLGLRLRGPAGFGLGRSVLAGLLDVL
jgi:hypothetical protein